MTELPIAAQRQAGAQIRLSAVGACILVFIGRRYPQDRADLGALPQLVGASTAISIAGRTATSAHPRNPYPELSPFSLESVRQTGERALTQPIGIALAALRDTDDGERQRFAGALRLRRRGIGVAAGFEGLPRVVERQSHRAHDFGIERIESFRTVNGGHGTCPFSVPGRPSEQPTRGGVGTNCDSAGQKSVS